MQNCNRADPVLEAALQTVLDFGVRRTTLTEVARRAGVSRMTVYRRYDDASELMRALMSREFGAVLEVAQVDSMGAGDARRRVVGGVVGTVRRLMEHPLMLRLLELEPDAMLPYLTERVGAFQAAARAALSGWIAEGQATGSIRAGDPDRLATCVELACRGPVIAARSLEPSSRAALLAELEEMLERYLRP
jgi:AcrR family transcriptional regulator